MLMCFQILEIRLVISQCLKKYFSGETVLYFHQFNDYERFFQYSENYLEKKIL